MVNKKGWVRIIEATICALIIISVVLIYAQDNSGDFDSGDYRDVESAINEMVMEKDIRAQIISSNNGFNSGINSKLLERIKRKGIGVNNSICNYVDISTPICTPTKPVGIKNIHAYERIISTDLDSAYDGDKVKIVRIIIFEER